MSVATIAARARTSGHRSLINTVASLIATTGITSVLGVAYWWLAAHRTTMAAVGNGSAAVSAMTLAGTFGMAGLNTALIPRLARRPGDADGLLSAALWASAAVSAALAAGFWLVVAAADPRLAPYLHTGQEGAIFIVGAALTGAGLVLDEAVLGLLGGSPQLWRNATFAVTKLAVLAGLAAVWHDMLGTPLLAAWVAGTALSLLVAVALLHRKGVRLAVRPRWEALRGLARESAANTWLNNSLLAPTLLTPILVTGMLSAQDGGAFYVASTVLSVVTLLSFHFTTALYAAGTADPDALAAKLRFTLRVSMLGGLAGVPITILAAHPLLRVFGAQYAAQATLPLKLMIIGYFGTALKNHYVALCRLNNKITSGAVFCTVSCGLRLVAVVAGGLADGLTGLSIALLIVMCAEGVYTLPAIRTALRGSARRAPAGAAPAAAPAVPPALATGLAARVPAADGGRRVRVVYYLQTHARPAQITRLVEAITAGSPDALVLIGHDATGAALDVAALEALGDVHVLLDQGGYGDFSHVERYLAAVDWLDENGIDYDWLENLTGQDYPLRPVAEIEETLAAAECDGFLLYSPVFPGRVPGDADQGAAAWYTLCRPFDATMRYDYRHWRLGKPTLAKRRLMRPLMALNLVQPWIRVNTAFASVGVRRRRTVFGPDFHCYGGSFFCTLRAECARYVRDYARNHPGEVAYFRRVLAPDEVFLHSVLVNAGRFTFVPDYKRYIDWTGSKYNHPKVLGADDLPAMLASGAHWARKLDLGQGDKLFDILDQRIRRGPWTLHDDALTGVCAAQ